MMRRVLVLAGLSAALSVPAIAETIPTSAPAGAGRMIERVDVAEPGESAAPVLDRAGMRCDVRFDSRVAVVTFTDGTIELFALSGDNMLRVAGSFCSIRNVATNGNGHEARAVTIADPFKQ